MLGCLSASLLASWLLVFSRDKKMKDSYLELRSGTSGATYQFPPWHIRCQGRDGRSAPESRTWWLDRPLAHRKRGSDPLLSWGPKWRRSRGPPCTLCILRRCISGRTVPCAYCWSTWVRYYALFAAWQRCDSLECWRDDDDDGPKAIWDFATDLYYFVLCCLPWTTCEAIGVLLFNTFIISKGCPKVIMVVSLQCTTNSGGESPTNNNGTWRQPIGYSAFSSCGLQYCANFRSLWSNKISRHLIVCLENYYVKVFD